MVQTTAAMTHDLAVHAYTLHPNPLQLPSLTLTPFGATSAMAFDLPHTANKPTL